MDVTQTKKSYNQIIFRDWCESCGICSAFCPKKVIGSDKTGAPVIEHPENCIGCRFCEIHCPDFAITVKERILNQRDMHHEPRHSKNRMRLLQGTCG